MPRPSWFEFFKIRHDSFLNGVRLHIGCLHLLFEPSQSNSKRCVVGFLCLRADVNAWRELEVVLADVLDGRRLAEAWDFLALALSLSKVLVGRRNLHDLLVSQRPQPACDHPATVAGINEQHFTFAPPVWPAAIPVFAEKPEAHRNSRSEEQPVRELDDAIHKVLLDQCDTGL